MQQRSFFGGSNTKQTKSTGHNAIALARFFYPSNFGTVVFCPKRFSSQTRRLASVGQSDEQHAWLSHFGSPNYATLGIYYDGNQKFLEWNAKGRMPKGPAMNKEVVWLKKLGGWTAKSFFIIAMMAKRSHRLAKLLK